MAPPPPPGSPHRKVVAKAPSSQTQSVEELPALEKLEEIKNPLAERKKWMKKETKRPVKKARKTKKKAKRTKKVRGKKKALVSKKKKRRPTAVSKTFKGGMLKFRKKCAMHSKPGFKSAKVGSVRPGKKLWVDAHNRNWRKVYKKSGIVFVHRNCF